MHFTQWHRVMTHTPCQSQRPWFSPVKPDLNNSIREIIVELAGIRFNTFARYDWTLADDRWDRKSGSKGIIFLNFSLHYEMGLKCCHLTCWYALKPHMSILHSIKGTLHVESSWWFIDWQTKFGIITICERNLLCSPAAFIWSNSTNSHIFQILQFKITVLYLNIFFYLIYSCDEGDPLKKLLYIYIILLLLSTATLKGFAAWYFVEKVIQYHSKFWGKYDWRQNKNKLIL